MDVLENFGGGATLSRPPQEQKKKGKFKAYIREALEGCLLREDYPAQRFAANGDFVPDKKDLSDEEWRLIEEWFHLQDRFKELKDKLGREIGSQVREISTLKAERDRLTELAAELALKIEPSDEERKWRIVSIWKK